MTKIITLDSDGYVNCIGTDIGKQVTDDAVEIGLLLAYNNATREWWVDTELIVAGNSTMAITAGTGSGAAILSIDEPYEDCCTVATIKERTLNITADEEYDVQLQAAIDEAEQFVFDRLRPYIGDSDSAVGDDKWEFSSIPPIYVPCALCAIICDIAAGIFLKRHFPKEMNVGWWGIGLKKLEYFIKSNFHQGVVGFYTAGGVLA